MSDETEPKPDVEFDEPVPSSPFTSYEPEEEFITEEELAKTSSPETPTGPTREELEKDLAKIRADLEAAQRRGDEVTAMRASMEEVAEAIKRQPRAEVPVQRPQESEEDFAKRFNENYIENPYQAQIEFQRRKLEPIFNTLVSRNMFVSRKFAEKDHPDTFVRYASEIDAEVNKPNVDKSDPEVYEKAHNIVVAKHLEDLRTIDREQLKAELLEELKSQNVTSRSSGPPPPTGPGSQPPPGPTRPQVVVKMYHKTTARNIALRKYGSDSKEDTDRVLSLAQGRVNEGIAKDFDDALRQLS